MGSGEDEDEAEAEAGFELSIFDEEEVGMVEKYCTKIILVSRRASLRIINADWCNVEKVWPQGDLICHTQEISFSVFSLEI